MTTSSVVNLPNSDALPSEYCRESLATSTIFNQSHLSGPSFGFSMGVLAYTNGRIFLGGSLKTWVSFEPPEPPEDGPTSIYVCVMCVKRLRLCHVIVDLSFVHV